MLCFASTAAGRCRGNIIDVNCVDDALCVSPSLFCGVCVCEGGRGAEARQPRQGLRASGLQTKYRTYDGFAGDVELETSMK